MFYLEPPGGAQGGLFQYISLDSSHGKTSSVLPHCSIPSLEFIPSHLSLLTVGDKTSRVSLLRQFLLLESETAWVCSEFCREAGKVPVNF